MPESRKVLLILEVDTFDGQININRATHTRVELVRSVGGNAPLLGGLEATPLKGI